MFTGLIEQLGRLTRVERRGADARLLIESGYRDLSLGESVAVDGACLTVESIDGATFTAAASAETLRVTTLGRAQAGQVVHLERALAVDGRLGGHIVTGHVDAIGRVRDRQPRGAALRVTYELPPELEPLVADKGSITIDGVSLTVNGGGPGTFWVMLVPFTRSETHLDRKQPGEPVNLEADVLAKYVERLLRFRGSWDEGDPVGGEVKGGGLSMELLLKQGFKR